MPDVGDIRPVYDTSLYFQVQIETIGEFGVFIIMFVAGMEFSMDRLRKVWRIAIQGPMLIMAIMVLTGQFYVTFS